MTTTNTSIENWLSFLNKETNNFSNQIMPLFDLTVLIERIFNHEDSPFLGLEVIITYYSIEFRTKILGELLNPIERTDPFNGTPSNFCIRYELKNKNISSDTWYGNFIKLLSSAWLPKYRKYGELDLKQDSLKELLPSALKRMFQQNSQGVYCIFADLDNFKNLNDQTDHDTGDIAIRNVHGIIESLGLSERLINTTNGGDEYVLFIENKGEVSLLNTLDTIKKRICELEYQSKKDTSQKIKIGITFGVHKLENFDDIDSNISQAEAATKKLNNDGKYEKKRGTVSFDEINSISFSDKKSIDNNKFIELAISLILSRQNYDIPFSNALLNFISRVTFNFFIEKQDKENKFLGYIDSYIKWLGMDLSAEPHQLELIGDNHSNTKVSQLSFILAIAHGILKSKSDHTLLLKTDSIGNIALIEQNSGKIIFGHEFKDNEPTTDYKIGTSLKNINTTNEIFSNCVLIMIISSYQDLFTENLPHNLFADIIAIDSRPNIGGGLPDFWQAAIAQLIDIISTKNINKILVHGDETSAPKLTNLLKDSVNINVDEITDLTASPRAETQKCIDFLKEKDTLVFCTSIQEVISKLYLSMLQLKCNETPPKKYQREHYLTRKADFRDSQLELIQGMQCATAAIAYPSILELLRSNDDDEINTFDNADKLLKEIIGFKLLLDSPLENKIPDYWLRKSKEELRDYAQNQLIAESGLIGEKLHEQNQLAAFLNHLAEYCRPDSKTKTSTRRAILIIPNKFTSSDMTPLGLVSIWVTPRFRNGCYTLDYCFVWRTVEALVGLPYSLYGSIKLAEYIKKELDKKFGFDTARDSNLKIGKLTYIALSLHMKVDDYTKRIAKSIVDAASK